MTLTVPTAQDKTHQRETGETTTEDYEGTSRTTGHVFGRAFARPKNDPSVDVPSPSSVSHVPFWCVLPSLKGRLWLLQPVFCAWMRRCSGFRRTYFYRLSPYSLRFLNLVHSLCYHRLKKGSQSTSSMVAGKHPCKLSFNNSATPLRGFAFFLTTPLLCGRGTGRVLGAKRPPPSPTRSPMRWAGQPHPCITPAKDVFALWANRRGYARIMRPFGQESLYGHRPWQVAARGSAPLLALPQRRCYCTPLRCAHRSKDVAAALRSAAPRYEQHQGGRWFSGTLAYKPAALVRIQFFGHLVCLTAASQKTTQRPARLFAWRFLVLRAAQGGTPGDLTWCAACAGFEQRACPSA